MCVGIKVDKIGNVTVHYDNGVYVDDNTVWGDDKFKITIIIDNVTQHHYKLYKLSVDEVRDKEGDVLLTLYSEVTRISSNILLPKSKDVLVIVNDSFWS